MTLLVELIPSEVQALLKELQESSDLGGTLQSSKLYCEDLTKTLCWHDTVDAIVVDEDNHFYFLSNVEQENNWDVYPLEGKPVYTFSAEMIGPDDYPEGMMFDFQDALEYELDGFDIVQDHVNENPESIGDDWKTHFNHVFQDAWEEALGVLQ